MLSISKRRASVAFQARRPVGQNLLKPMQRLTGPRDCKIMLARDVTFMEDHTGGRCVSDSHVLSSPILDSLATPVGAPLFLQREDKSLLPCVHGTALLPTEMFVHLIEHGVFVDTNPWIPRTFTHRYSLGARLGLAGLESTPIHTSQNVGDSWVGDMEAHNALTVICCLQPHHAESPVADSGLL